MLRFRLPVDKMILIIAAILHLKALPSFCGPTNSIDSLTYSEYGNTGTAATESKRESLNNFIIKFFGISTTQTPNPILLSPAEPNEKFTTPGPNVSKIFYYREKVPNYPDISKIEHVLKKFERFFDTNELDPKALLEEEKYLHLCGNKVEPLTAQEVKNTRGDKVLLANAGKFIQTLHVEICGELEGTMCNEDLKDYYDGFQPECKQNYITRKMVVVKVNPDDTTDINANTDDIRIPACCECVLKKLT